MNARGTTVAGEWKGATRLQRGVLVAVFVLGGAGLYSIYQDRFGASAEAKPVIEQLTQMSEALDAADQKGDRSAALALVDPAHAALVSLNDRAGIETMPLQNCRLAAAHLTKGIIDVYQGGRWSNRDRFQAALSDCR